MKRVVLLLTILCAINLVNAQGYSIEVKEDTLSNVRYMHFMLPTTDDYFVFSETGMRFFYHKIEMDSSSNYLNESFPFIFIPKEYLPYYDTIMGIYRRMFIPLIEDKMLTEDY